MKKYSQLILFVLLSVTSTAFCQTKDSTYKYWLSINYAPIYNFQGDYTFSLADNFYKVGYFYKEGLPGDKDAEVRSIIMLIGQRFQSKWFHASLFCGPSYIFGSRAKIPTFYEKFHTAGLDSQIQLLFRIANEIGIGLTLNGNLNFVKNFGVGCISITIGNGK